MAAPTRAAIVRGLFDDYKNVMKEMIDSATRTSQVRTDDSGVVVDAVIKSADATKLASETRVAAITGSAVSMLTQAQYEERVRNVQGQADAAAARFAATEKSYTAALSQLTAKMDEKRASTNTKVDAVMNELRRTYDVSAEQFRDRVELLSRNVSDATNGVRDAEVTKREAERVSAENIAKFNSVTELLERAKLESRAIQKELNDTQAHLKNANEAHAMWEHNSLERDKSLGALQSAITTQIGEMQEMLKKFDSVVGDIVTNFETSEGELKIAVAERDGSSRTLAEEISKLKTLSDLHTALMKANAEHDADVKKAYEERTRHLEKQIVTLQFANAVATGGSVDAAARARALSLLELANSAVEQSCAEAKASFEVAQLAKASRTTAIITVVKLFHNSNETGSKFSAKDTTSPLQAKMALSLVGGKQILRVSAATGMKFTDKSKLQFEPSNTMVGVALVRSNSTATPAMHAKKNHAVQAISKYNEQHVKGYAVRVFDATDVFPDDHILITDADRSRFNGLKGTVRSMKFDEIRTMLASVSAAAEAPYVEYNVDAFFGHQASAPEVFSGVQNVVPFSPTVGICFVATGASGTGKTSTLLGRSTGYSYINGITTDLITYLLQSTNNEPISVCIVDVYMQTAHVVVKQDANYALELLSAESMPLVLPLAAAIEIRTKEEFVNLMPVVSALRVIRNTPLNPESSRSHMFLFIATDAETARRPGKQGTFTVADLAGDENSNFTTAAYTAEELALTMPPSSSTPEIISYVAKMMNNELIIAEGAAINADLNTMRAYLSNDNVFETYSELKYKPVAKGIAYDYNKFTTTDSVSYTPISSAATDMYKLVRECCTLKKIVLFAMVKLDGKAAVGISNTLKFVTDSARGNSSASVRALSDALSSFVPRTTCSDVPRPLTEYSTASVDAFVAIMNDESTTHGDLTGVFKDIAARFGDSSSSDAYADDKLTDAIAARARTAAAFAAIARESSKAVVT